MLKTSSANRTIFVVSCQNCVAKITLTTLTVKRNIVPGKWHFTTLLIASFLSSVYQKCGRCLHHSNEIFCHHK